MNEENSSDSREKSEYWAGSNHIYYRGWCSLWFFGVFFLTIILNKFWQSHISGWWMTDINGILAYYFGKSNDTPLQYSCLENPWTEEPGRLQSMGLLRVRHDWATSLSLFSFMHWRRKWQPTPVFLPGESQEWWGLVGCRPWGHTESEAT